MVKSHIATSTEVFLGTYSTRLKILTLYFMAILILVKVLHSNMTSTDQVLEALQTLVA